MNKLIELKNAVKSKVLFRTEDGVAIYVGDEYHPILFNSLEYKGKYKAQSLTKGNNWTNPCSCRMFSTKEAAELYIIFNKPCLSFNDVVKHFNVHPANDVFTAAKSELKRLIKTKL